MNLDAGETRLIIETGRRFGLLRNQMAYVLATAYHETAHTMEPVRETLATTDQAAIARLERAWKKGQLKWVKTPYWRDGWFGRGFVQLTHERNYIKAQTILGVDLTTDPAHVMDPEISAMIIVRGMIDGWFTGKKLADYITLKASNYVGARRIVNGTDRAQAIAEHARDYEAALKSEGYGQEKPAPIANDRRDGRAPRKNVMQTKTVLAATAVAATGAVGLSPELTETLTVLANDFGVPDAKIGPGIAILSSALILFERVRKFLYEGDR